MISAERLLELAKVGRFQEIDALLRQLMSKRLSASERLAFADAAVRVHRFSLALEILHSSVFPEGARMPQGSEAERLVYTLALMGLGSTRSAHGLLDSLSVDRNPIVFRIRGTLYRKTWAFERALPWLELAEKNASPGSIDWLVSRKERLLALLLSEGPNAKWDRLYQEIPNDYPLPEPLLLECRFIRVLAEVERNCLELARQELKALRAELPIGAFGSIGALLGDLNSWLERDPSAEAATIARLDPPTFNQAQLTHPDYFRIVEFLIAKSLKDQRRLLTLYVGTPYFGLKKRLLPVLSDFGGLPRNLDWSPRPSSSSQKSIWTLDLSTGKFHGIDAAIHPGSLASRILKSLLSDLYSPRHLLEFFYEIYPGEIYSPSTSPLKIHQALFRLRKWCHQHGIGISANVTDGLVVLELPERSVFTFPIERPWIDPHQADLGVLAVAAQPTQLGTDLISLARKTGASIFGAIEVESHFGVSRRTANRFIKDLVETGWLIRNASGKKTTYQWSEEALGKLGATPPGPLA